MKIVKRIHKANAGRHPVLLALKYRALRTSPFTFFRGTCRLFYQRLAGAGFDVAAPAVWCCGDLHLENFGSYKGDNRLVYFDINDFDEAALAPATWELVRLAASLCVGLMDLGMSNKRATGLVEDLIGAYALALASGKASWIERDSAQGVVRQLLDKLRQRSRIDFLDSRTHLVDGQRRLLVDTGKALAVAPSERTLVTHTIDAFAASQEAPEFFRVLDVAHRIAGTGSLGVLRYVILVEGHGSPDRNYLIDLKRASPSALARAAGTRQPHWKNDAQRVASVQQRMQAVPAAWLHPVVHAGQPFVLRALQPGEDRLPFDEFGAEPALFDGAMAMMARCLAWGQLRSSGWHGAATTDALIAFGAKKKWRRQVARVASAMAEQVMADWATYCAAYDAGEFAVDGAGTA